MSLTKEELDELAQLEKEDQERKAALASEAQRQHLEALRLSKRLRSKYGEPGRGFLVLETVVGNIAIRKPLDIEIDPIDENSGREALETYALAITVEPSADEIRKLLAENPGLLGAIVNNSQKLLKVEREAEAKK